MIPYETYLDLNSVLIGFLDGLDLIQLTPFILSTHEYHYWVQPNSYHDHTHIIDHHVIIC